MGDLDRAIQISSPSSVASFLRTVGSRTWARVWNGLAPFDRGAEPILRHLVQESFLDRDGDMLFIGPEAERRFGHRHFLDMTAVFTAPPQFTVLEGRREIGRTDPALLTERVEGPRVLLLSGRSWKVTWIDWKRRRCFVEPVDARGGRGGSPRGSAERAMRLPARRGRCCSATTRR